MKPQEAFGRIAEVIDNATVAAGRAAFQAEQERWIVDDVAAKLRLEPEHRLLEVGCGTGNLLVPLASRVAAATGIDHLSCLARIESGEPPLTLIPGSWPEVELAERFDRVLVYSVLHYLVNAAAADRFVNACIDVLEPDGLLLLGDLPNMDAARRLSATDFGERLNAAYRRRRAETTPDDAARDAIFAKAEGCEPYIDDKFILATVAGLRGRGLECYILPQPPNLPFSYTREDVLVWKRPS